MLMTFTRPFLALLLLALLSGWAYAQEDAPSFGEPLFEAPPREETGPLVKTVINFGADPTPAAQSDAQASPGPDSSSTGPNRTRDYVDGLLNGLITAGEIPGATIVVIQNGQISHKAGYGFADIRNRTKVDPDKTLFRVASISKLFTATAVMQIAEQGRVDLNADVNTYLPAFKIAGAYPEPVTLANLLTHTAGFDDRYRGMAAPLAAPVETLVHHLSRAMPPRVLPPNRVIAYSNYGFALAGHVVENMSGQDFNTYVGEQIFKPLGMTRSSFGVPFPIPNEIAVPYFKGGSEGGYRRSDLDASRVGPAGDLLTTSGDIANFMLAHLNKGAYADGAQLLSEASIEQMHKEHFANAEGLDGWAFGFATGRRNGISWIGHDGSWRGYCAQLVLHPETRSGFFVAYNVDCHHAASTPLRKALFDLLWPSNTQVIPTASPEMDLRARQAAGTYMHVRRARSDFSAFAAVVGQIKVTTPGGGELRVTQTGSGRELVFLPQANGNWKNPDLQINAAFKPDGNGAGATFFIDSSAYDKVTLTAQGAFWIVALVLVVAICVMTMWGWASGFFSRHLFGEPQAVITFAPRVVAFICAGLVLASLVSLAALLSDSAPTAILHGPSPILIILLCVPVIVALLAVPMIVWSVTGFGDGPRARLAQIGYMILTLAILTFIAFCIQWNIHPLSVMTG